MSKRVDDANVHDVEPFDCIHSGEPYREFKKRALQHLASVLDESGSSLADHLLDIDMGGR